MEFYEIKMPAAQVQAFLPNPMDFISAGKSGEEADASMARLAEKAKQCLQLGNVAELEKLEFPTPEEMLTANYGEFFMEFNSSTGEIDFQFRLSVDESAEDAKIYGALEYCFTIIAE